MRKSALLLASWALIGPVCGETIGIYGQLGTLGAGAGMAVSVGSALEARIGVNGFAFSMNRTSGNVDYDARVKLRSADALLDWFPWANGLRVSIGAAYNDNRIDLNGRPSMAGAFTLNGMSFSASQVGMLRGDVTFQKAAPYVGIGWGRAAGAAKGVGLVMDLGALYQGFPKVRLSASGMIPAAFAESARRQLESDLRGYRWYPIASVGLAYRF